MYFRSFDASGVQCTFLCIIYNLFAANAKTSEIGVLAIIVHAAFKSYKMKMVVDHVYIYVTSKKPTFKIITISKYRLISKTNRGVVC